MATDYCGSRSEPVEAVTSVNCQHVCEMVLAMRTFVTACVYFRDPRCRAQLWDLPLGPAWALSAAAPAVLRLRPARQRRRQQHPAPRGVCS